MTLYEVSFFLSEKMWNLVFEIIFTIQATELNIDKYKHITDHQLLQNFYEDSNNEWLGILLKRYTMLLFGVSMKYLKNEENAKDAVQQVFLKVIAELHKYKVEYFKSWLYMIAKNHCLMQLRNPGNHAVEINEKIQLASDDSGYDELLKQQEINLAELENALKQLNTEQKECVTLFYLEKKSYKEICEITNYSLLEIKSHIQNGKRNLKIKLQHIHS
jgi:RNA polymerase sigma factor (sigma-70 family)